MSGVINYTLVEIKEEEVPLYAGHGDTYYSLTIAVMTVLLITAFLVTYFVICSRYRSSIRELDAGSDKKLGWRLWRLRKTVNELELRKSLCLYWRWWLSTSSGNVSLICM